FVPLGGGGREAVAGSELLFTDSGQRRIIWETPHAEARGIMVRGYQKVTRDARDSCPIPDCGWTFTVVAHQDYFLSDGQQGIDTVSPDAVCHHPPVVLLLNARKATHVDIQALLRVECIQQLRLLGVHRAEVFLTQIAESRR